MKTNVLDFLDRNKVSISVDELSNLRGQLTAINKVMGTIEFDLAGNILDVSESFAQLTGYSPQELVAKHHSIFVETAYKSSPEYKAFWEKLGSGVADSGQYQRIGKGGREVWLQASYNPIFDAKGKPYKVVKYATDITADKLKNAGFEGQIAAIDKVMGVIEFDLKGNILAVNDNFAAVTGYTKQEIIGNHHSMFADPVYKASHEYKAFWDKLGRGEADEGQYKRIAKGGREVWLQASYNPIFDMNGKPFKVVKYATDITQEKLQAANVEGQLKAIGKVMGVIEFDLKGNILAVNDNFAAVTGYTNEEIVGNHHSMFADPIYKASNEYKAFWDKLGRGEADEGQYKRIAKGGREVWLQASYNPIFDMNGKPYKVVKYATDITAEKLKNADFEGQIAAISKVSGVIEFDLKGNITSVNDNFATVTGYSHSEIVGKHHSMFVDANYRNSNEYKAFWEKLARGDADAGQYKRFNKHGAEVWLQASYNPIFDMNGKPFKVVKYATDVSKQVNANTALELAVAQTEQVVSAAKDGDLTQRIPLEGKVDAIANLCQGINSLIENMAEIITVIKQASETINTAAAEISTGNTDLSQRTEEQASSLEETAASMEELSSTVKQNAENAKQANSMVIAASSVAMKGGSVVEQVVVTMAEISTSSSKIEEIISVIDGIAFQTNILALNAAVEAARAGEQGRGFAVVAGEVRNLAQRSAAAAKEIKQLISNSVQTVSDGTKLVEVAGTTMQEIVTSVNRVTDIMGEISAASQEQSTGIDQVNQAVTQMDEVTQQNAALVEESAAAAMSLVDQANLLLERVSIFKLNAGDTGSRKAAPQSRKVSRPDFNKARSEESSKPAKPVKALKTGSDDEDWAEF